MVAARGRLRLLAAALVLTFAAAGCAAKWAYRQGQGEAEKGNWDLAVARFTRALQKDPGNIRYKIALENARIQASRHHYAEARKHLAAEDLDLAADSLEVAVKYDPANRAATNDLEIVREKILRREEERRRREDFDGLKTRAQALRVPMPVLSPRDPHPIVLSYKDTSLQRIFESLGKLAGVNILFDEAFRDKRTDFNVTGVTFQEALDQLTFVNRSFYKVLDQNTVIIVPESAAKRRAYDEVFLRTFYLQNADVQETLNLVKTLAKITTAMGNPGLGSITVLSTPDKVALAEKIIEANDKTRGEVMIEVQILNVNRTRAREYGLRLSNYGAALTFSPSGAPGELTETGLTNIRAHLLSSFNLADFVVSVPSAIFTRFLQTESSTRILAAPRLRAAEGKRTQLRIGQEVPVPVTTFQATQTGGTTFTPATSFQYRNVGVNLDLTPRVSAGGEVSLELTAEFSLLGAPTAIAGSDLPTFLLRSITGTLRMRDGETALIGGLLQRDESDAFTGIFGLQSIPLINKLLTNRTGGDEETEILMSITPHIVRAPKLTEDDLVPLHVGTEEVPRVRGARPPLFGPPEEVAPAPEAAPAEAPPGPLAEPAAPDLPAEPELGADAEPLPIPGPEERPARPVTLVLSPSELSLGIGQLGSLSLVVVGAQELLGVDLVLAYDASLVELADIGAGSLLTLDGATVGSERALEGGRARVRLVRTTPVSGSGAVASVSLRGLRPGSGSLSVETATLVHSAGEERPTPPAAARVNVGP